MFSEEIIQYSRNFFATASPNIMEPGQQCTPPRQKLAKDIKKHNLKHPSKGDLKTKQNKTN
jgi:hypothetical protein